MDCSHPKWLETILRNLAPYQRAFVALHPSVLNDFGVPRVRMLYRPGQHEPYAVSVQNADGVYAYAWAGETLTSASEFLVRRDGGRTPQDSSEEARVAAPSRSRDAMTDVTTDDDELAIAVVDLVGRACDRGMRAPFLVSLTGANGAPFHLIAEVDAHGCIMIDRGALH